MFGASMTRSKKRKAKAQDETHGPEPASTSMPLVFGGWQYGWLGFTGFCGAIPVTTWLMSVVSPLHLDNHPVSGVSGAIVVIVPLLLMLVAPWLVPCLVLRWRQPRGARIEWDEEEIVEWDGAWRKAVIAWKDVEVARHTWTVKARSSSYTCEALQLFARTGPQIITVWDSAPDGAPTIRRRLISDRVGILVKVIEQRGIATARTHDWSLACDPDRPPHRLATILGRFGYPCAALAPLLTLPSRPPLIPIVVGCTGAALLSLRAMPSFREVRAIVARMRASRAAGGDGRADADRLKLGCARRVGGPRRVRGVDRALDDRVVLRGALRANALRRGGRAALHSSAQP